MKIPASRANLLAIVDREIANLASSATWCRGIRVGTAGGPPESFAVDDVDAGGKTALMNSIQGNKTVLRA